MTKPALHGLRILNTRPQAAGKALSAIIRKAGGTALDCPALLIKPVKENVLQSLHSLRHVQLAIFISANAVHFAIRQIAERKLDWPASIDSIAIGQKTAAALKNHRIHVSCQPETCDSEHLIQLPLLQQVKGQDILLFKGQGGRRLIEQTLSQRGAKLTLVEVYRREIPPYRKSMTDSIWRNDAVDIILFTSEQAMHNLFSMFGKEAYHWLCSKPCLVISERLAESAARLGAKHIMISPPDSVFATLCDYNQGLIHGRQQ